MSTPKVHPLRKKHRRGRRSGKKRHVVTPPPAVTALPIAPPAPEALRNLRRRLSLLAKP